MKRLLKNASKVSGLTMVSRVFGLVRDQLFAAMIGAGFFADCFVIAFRIPNLLRDLFAEGALSNAFVPTLTKTIYQDSPKQGLVMVSKLMGLIIFVVGTIIVLGILFAPQIVHMIAPGFSAIAGKVDQTAELARILFPFLLFVSLGAVLMGIHHAHQSFTYPSIAPLMFNAASIAGGLVIHFGGYTGKTAVMIWSVGTLCGGFLQFAIQAPPLLRAKKIPLPSFKKILANRRVREMMILMGPAIIALSGAQINILVNTILASLLEEGAPSWLNYGFRLMQLPIGIFGVAIGVVALAQASKDVSANDNALFHRNIEHAMNLNWLLTMPCAVGLWVMAQPIVALLFERGAFTAFDTEMTAKAIQFYALGLPFYAGVKVKGPIFFTRNLARIPMVASLTGIAINILFNVLMYKKLGHWGLALGTSIGMLMNFLLLSIYFNRKFTPPQISSSVLFFFKVIIISVLMGVLTHQISHQVFTDPAPTEIYKILHVIVTIACAMVGYVVLVKAFGIWGLLKQVLKKD
ncbi:MAG: murein biosynthesis integral membrane protein MurJ [Deltaproteobacteria bacterium]|nr:murein biosynthesis integral membrane protein MurJ [Deltaproteobacteria bacterium]